MNKIRAEFIVLVRRPATWVLLGLGVLLNLFVGYVAPYISYASASGSGASERIPDGLLPQQILANILEGFPFYVAMFGLILGVLTLGNEYAQGTLKTLLMQDAGRARLLVAKLSAIGASLFVFTLVIGVTSALAAATIGAVEGASTSWPPAVDLASAFGAGWLILSLWAFFGALLAVLTRGTSMAIGLGILYGLVIEGLVSAFGTDISLLRELSQGFLRANGYSLIEPLGASAPRGGEPGAFPGPFVSATQAVLVSLAYLVLFALGSVLLIRRRDVT